MGRRQPLEKLSVRDLERTLALRRRTERRAASAGGPGYSHRPAKNWAWSPTRRLFSFLTVIELALIIGVFATFGTIYHHAEWINSQARRELAGAVEATATPLIRAVVLPSGHTPPSGANEARFNLSEIPESLRPVQQAYMALPIPTEAPQQARSIFIPRLWESGVPIVQGDGWEQLKKGVAQHLGSAEPGELGNLVLSGHNDVYGEWFRYLDRLQPGDPIYITTASRQLTYRVTGTEIVEPAQVAVMDPTKQATITLISCYPYLIDNQRIVVFGVLDA